MFKGSLPALVTPFKDGAVDHDALAALVDWQILSGSHGLVPCGTTGESPTLSSDEADAVLDTVLQAAARRVPVIMGCGGNNTAAVVEKVRKAAKTGADGALVVCPYYNKPNQEGLYQHFRAVAESADLPILIYNIPGRSVVDMSVATMARLATLPGIVGVKDATGDLARVAAARLVIGADFCQLSGEDATAVGFNAMGGVGCISVTANVAPAMCAALQTTCLEGDYARARGLQDQLTGLHQALFAAPSPAPAKYALARLNRMADTVRLPLTPVDEATRTRVDAALRATGLLREGIAV